MELDHSLDAAANRIHGKRINLKSKKNYSGKLNNIKAFLLTKPHYAEICLDDEGVIKCPLPEFVMKELFG